jgi:hypothetical protein
VVGAVVDADATPRDLICIHLVPFMVFSVSLVSLSSVSLSNSEVALVVVVVVVVVVIAVEVATSVWMAVAVIGKRGVEAEAEAEAEVGVADSALSFMSFSFFSSAPFSTLDALASPSSFY